MPLPVPPGRMTRAQFIAAFAEVFEDSPWVAEEAWAAGLAPACDTPAGLAAAMARIVEGAGEERQHALIMAHPVLGADKKMGAYSAGEQRQAGFAGLPAGQRRRLQQLNADYMEKFSMPFIMAVKGAAAGDIIAALERRLQNRDAAAERRCALDEIYKIARFRLDALWQ